MQGEKKRSGCIKRTYYCTAVLQKIFDSERSNNTSGSSLKVLDTALQNKIGKLLILRGNDLSPPSSSPQEDFSEKEGNHPVLFMVGQSHWSEWRLAVDILESEITLSKRKLHWQKLLTQWWCYTRDSFCFPSQISKAKPPVLIHMTPPHASH